MATLQITIANVDHGAATGEASNNVRRGSYSVDSVPQSDCFCIIPSATSDADAVQAMRDLLTANGVEWTAEDPAVYV